ncbi:hypothetical protein NCG89_09205 [Spongiibacter taiwanensis]|uniref:hypothetical protein n=1 Tax=Spongiibacter taiwanensis TaxID=1748242 RepID=UPI00203634C0|nr:hypothetical protein [Spongiibacter taiwanensis]USA41696.1 hypothetical protein NCG89_09205 [Spongiibacter taiwanensis]
MEVTVLKQLANVLSMDSSWLLICLGALWVYKILKSKYEQHKIRKTETLGNIKEYFDLPQSERNIFLKELLFEDHFGKLLSWQEISFFLERRSPIQKIKRYMSCKKYIDICYESGSLSVKNGINLNRRKWLFLVMYFATGIPALYMLLGANYVFSNNGPELYAPWAIVTLSLATLAGIFMAENIATDTAKQLVSESNA